MRRLFTFCGLLLCVFAEVGAGTARQGTIRSWDALRAGYADTGNKPPVVATPKESGQAVVLHLSYPSADGSTVEGLFMRPKAEGVYPVIILMHGLGGNKDLFAGQLAGRFLAKGVAIFALDVPFHGERRTPETDSLLLSMLLDAMKSGVKGDLVEQVRSGDKNVAYAKLFVQMVHGGVLDYRRGLDYLDSRADVDPKRIGLMGYSLGSIMGSILASVDSRVSFAALCVGGDPVLPTVDQVPPKMREMAAEISPSLFIGHMDNRPVFMLNGTRDDVIPKSATDRLFDAAGEPKSIKWYDSGHTLPPQALQDAVDWSVARLRG